MAVVSNEYYGATCLALGGSAFREASLRVVACTWVILTPHDKEPCRVLTGLRLAAVSPRFETADAYSTNSGWSLLSTIAMVSSVFAAAQISTYRTLSYSMLLLFFYSLSLYVVASYL